MIRACFMYFSNMEICSLITVRSYFGFQKFFIVYGFKFFFNTIADFIINKIIFFEYIIIFNQKIYLFSFIIRTFHLISRFWKHYASKWFNFIIIIFVTNKAFIIFFIFCDNEIFVFRFQRYRTL